MPIMPVEAVRVSKKILQVDPAAVKKLAQRAMLNVEFPVAEKRVLPHVLDADTLVKSETKETIKMSGTDKCKSSYSPCSDYNWCVTHSYGNDY